MKKVSKKLKQTLKRLALVILTLILNFFTLANAVYATNTKNINVYAVNDCGSLLIYKGIVVKTMYVEYNENGNHYPAYCLDKTKPGVGDGSYNVSVDTALNDVGVWRRIINGYPYKSIEELGVLTREEAFTATKQAIYCYIHGNNPDDYTPIGEAGQRTLNAMKKIIVDAQNSKENQISNKIIINEDENDWKQDDINKEYLSKVYSVSAGANISNYEISLKVDNIQNWKLTNVDNEEKKNFSSDEKFKILIPIEELKEEGNIEITVKSTVETKPILYGKAPDSGHQDYALTAKTFENGTGELKDNYYKNETKIIIVKQDEETGKYLEGVEFQLLDKEKNIVYANLKTDENGKIVIENIVPGEYYIQEIKTIDGYEINNNLIKVITSLNEEVTVTVNNSKEKVEKTNKEITKKNYNRKLPVTGM